METHQPGNSEEAPKSTRRIKGFPSTGMREMPSFSNAIGNEMAKEYEINERARQKAEEKHARHEPDPLYDLLKPMGED